MQKPNFRIGCLTVPVAGKTTLFIEGAAAMPESGSVDGDDGEAGSGDVWMEGTGEEWKAGGGSEVEPEAPPARDAPKVFFIDPKKAQDLVRQREEMEMQKALEMLEQGHAVSKSMMAKLAKLGEGKREPRSDAGTIRKMMEQRQIWWVNGGGDSFEMYLKEWVCVTKGALDDQMTEDGLQDGERMLVRNLVRREHVLQAAWRAVAGYSEGVHTLKSGGRVLIRTEPKLIVPAEDYDPNAEQYPVIDSIISQLMDLGEEWEGNWGGSRWDQRKAFEYWLKRSVENLMESVHVPLLGHILFIAGEAGSGKSLLQDLIITPLLGNRTADPQRFLFGETPFNNDWIGAPHLGIQDPKPNFRRMDRMQFAQMLKGLAVNEHQRLEGKGLDAVADLNPKFRVSISLNSNPATMMQVPPLSSDFADKVMLLLVRRVKLPMSVDTVAEKDAFRGAVAAEMPYYLRYLLNLPPLQKEWRCPNSRMGVKYWHHPDLKAMILEESTAMELLDVIDQVKLPTGMAEDMPHSGFWEYAAETAEDAMADLRSRGAGDKNPAMAHLERWKQEGRRVWIGSYGELTDLLLSAKHKGMVQKVVGHNKVSTLLTELSEATDRVVSYKTGGMRSERGWLVASVPALSVSEGSAADEVTF